MTKPAPFPVHLLALHHVFFQSKVLTEGGPLILPSRGVKPLAGRGLALYCTDGERFTAASLVDWHESAEAGFIRAQPTALQTGLPAVALTDLGAPRPPLTRSDDTSDATSTDVSSTAWPAIEPVLVQHAAWRDVLRGFEPALLSDMAARGDIPRMALMAERGADLSGGTAPPSATMRFVADKPDQLEVPRTPLEHAAFNERIEAATWLLERGAKPTSNALGYAVVRGDRAMVRLLLDHGISPAAGVWTTKYQSAGGPTWDDVLVPAVTTAVGLAEKHGHHALARDLELEEARRKAHFPLEGGSYRTPPRAPS